MCILHTAYAATDSWLANEQRVFVKDGSSCSVYTTISKIGEKSGCPPSALDTYNVYIYIYIHIQYLALKPLGPYFSSIHVHSSPSTTRWWYNPSYNEVLIWIHLTAFKYAGGNPEL